MSTKFRRLILSVLCIALIAVPFSNSNSAYASDSSPTEISDTKDAIEDNTPSKAVSILVILAVFTVTCAGSAVITFRLRKKLNDKKHDSDNDNTNL